MELTIYALIFATLSISSVISQENVDATTSNRTKSVDDIYLRFYNGSTMDEFIEFPLPQCMRLFNVPGFRQNNPTVFYVHGYTENPYRESIKTVVTAYLESKPNTNIILVDWSNMNERPYLTNGSVNTQPVGVALATNMNILINNGLPLKNIHLIGHSLGGQVVGYTGRTLINSYGKTLKRITGLDPAFPNFYPDGIFLKHIRDTDAEFVDIIHTDAGGYGAPVPTGTVDFWPNGGRSVQPGCPVAFPLTDSSYCSHWRSWRFYAESVRNLTGFPAAPNDSYLKFRTSPPATTGIVYMGYITDPSSKGNYFLTTNSASPFAKGVDGLKP
ncbi:hypothetical protein ACJJTC_004470 [Scirpophaga incertulas]